MTTRLPVAARAVMLLATAVMLTSGTSRVLGYTGGSPGHQIELVSHELLPEGAYDVSVSGDYAFVTDWFDCGLHVLDVSDPANPTEVAFWTDPREPLMDIVTSQGYAYVLTYWGFYVFDISDPINPVLVGEAGVDEPLYIAVQGHYAYVTTDEGGFWVVDISDPTDPTNVGHYDPYDPWDCRFGTVAVAGRYVYVRTSLHGLLILDVSDPAHPREAGSYEGVWGPVTGGLAEPYVYARSEGRLHVLDVSDPAHPAEVGSCPIDGGRVTVVGKYAYIAGYPTVQVVDVSDPAHPALIASCETVGGWSWGSAVSEAYLYQADRDEGLVVYRHTGPGDILPPSVKPFMEPEDLEVDANLCPGTAVLKIYAVASDTEGLESVSLDHMYMADGQPLEPIEYQAGGTTTGVFDFALGPVWSGYHDVLFQLNAADLAGNIHHSAVYHLTVTDCPTCTSWAVDFSPSADGFKFENFSTRWMGGFCTGMSSAAIDYFEYQEGIPPDYNEWVEPPGTDPGNPLSCYIKNRHLGINAATTPYAAYQAKTVPTDTVRNALELDKIQDRISGDNGTALVGLLPIPGHAVTAYAYTECTDGRKALYVYDSNLVFGAGGAFPGVINLRDTEDGVLIESASTCRGCLFSKGCCGQYEELYALSDWLSAPILPHYPDLSSCEDSHIATAVYEATEAGYRPEPLSLVGSTLDVGGTSPRYEFWNDEGTASAVFASWSGAVVRLSVFRPDDSVLTQTESGDSPLKVDIPQGQQEGFWSYEVTHLGLGGSLAGGETRCVSLVAYPTHQAFLPLILHNHGERAAKHEKTNGRHN